MRGGGIKEKLADIKINYSGLGVRNTLFEC